MSKPKTRAERNLMTVWPKNVERVKKLCAEYPDGGCWSDYCNDIIDTYLNNYRSGKPLALPEERFTERNGEGWDSICP